MRQASCMMAQGSAALRGTLLRPTPLMTALALGFVFAACDGSSDSPPERTFSREMLATPAPAPDNAAVFGFEIPGVWSNKSGATLAQSTTHSEGAASLSVRPGSNGYTPLVSVPLSTLPAVGPTLAVDVMLPRNQPNPNWYGTFQVYLNCPSRGIYSQFLAQVELTGKQRESWITLSFPVNNTIITGLARAGYSDLVITLALNVPTPNTGTYYVDNLRFVPVPANGCVGRPNGTVCNDGNGCTLGETCQANACQPKSTVTCAAPDQCHTAGTCQAATGTCQYPTKADGSACNDGNACTTTETCHAGTCQGGSPVVCEASDQCHVAGVCDPGTGTCSNPNQTDGTACNDSNACTVGDVCTAGACTGGSPLNCDDGLSCTVDTCDPTVGCVYTGECPRRCGGIGGLNCRNGEFCSMPAGTCGSTDVMGVCLPSPSVCPDMSDPVCGCNGTTYLNQCAADMAGIAVDHTGACVRRCGGIQGLNCQAGQFCSMPVGTCNSTEVMGVCLTSPSVCPDMSDPVCGCNGTTYLNQCAADMAGIAVDHTGACVRPCRGLQGLNCQAGQFCSVPAGTCNIPDVQGVCQPTPTSCPEINAPVCGCNGTTYANQCAADMAGVAVMSTGACPPMGTL